MFPALSKKDSTFGILIFGSLVLFITASKPHSTPGQWMRSTLRALTGGKRTRITDSLSLPPSTATIITPKKAQSSSTSSSVQYAGELVTLDNVLEIDNWRSFVSNLNEETECELIVINELDQPVYLCWVDQEGNLRGMRPINDKSIRDKSVSNQHTEYCYTGHCFICLINPEARFRQGKVSGSKSSSGGLSFPQHIRDVPNESLIFHYRPGQAQSKHTITLQPKVRKSFSLRGNNPLGVSVKLDCKRMTPEDVDVIDTTMKEYIPVFIHGFHVYCEPSVFVDTVGLEVTFSDDLQVLVDLLPPGACDQLRKSTPIYINKCISFGKKSQPVEGRTCTFHPLGGANWLKNNGLSVSKEGSIEIQCAEEYLESRKHWGPGGILVHEFSHAYHNKCCSDGYDNEEIVAAYEVAMKKKLYHQVKVHGPQGEKGLAKAYACSNCMEFFAELSVAYLWTKDDQEYNKWFPFNHKQLLEYDPDSFAILERIWNKFEGSNV